MFNIKQDKFNVGQIIPKHKDIKVNCPHKLVHKFWVPEKTLLVKRDGFGNAMKVVLERCKKCGETRKKEVHFSDIRVIR